MIDHGWLSAISTILFFIGTPVLFAMAYERIKVKR